MITIHHNTENKPTNLRVSIYTLNFIPWRVDSVTSHDFSTTDPSLDEVHICHIAYPSTAMHKEQELSASPVCFVWGEKAPGSLRILTRCWKAAQTSSMAARINQPQIIAATCGGLTGAPCRTARADGNRVTRTFFLLASQTPGPRKLGLRN